jgi:hypothetical protein
VFFVNDITLNLQNNAINGVPQMNRIGKQLFDIFRTWRKLETQII